MDFHQIKRVLKTQHTLLDHEWKGAVLFLCNEEHIFLIKRSELMPTHGGQMAFVGGHKMSQEVDGWTVAQREFEEETSLPRDVLEFLGYLPVVITQRLQPIMPVMVRLNISTDQFLKRAKSNGEWDSIIAYPWKEIMREERWEFAWRYGYSKIPIMFHPIPAGSYLSEINMLEPHLLWGATASIVWDFLRLYFEHEASPY